MATAAVAAASRNVRQNGTRQDQAPAATPHPQAGQHEQDDQGEHDEQQAELRRCQRRLLHLSLKVRLASTAALCLCSAFQQGFDTSPHLLALTLDPLNEHGLSFGGLRWLMAFVRWDTLYFLAAAAPSHVISSSLDPSPPASLAFPGGYTHEQMLAFQPAIVALLRLTGRLFSPTGQWSPASALLSTTLLANLATCIAPLLLFRLTWRHTASLQLSWLSAALSLLCPSGGTTLSAPTPEPFFSLFALLGMLALAPRHRPKAGAKMTPTSTTFARRLRAACCFAVATAFRANGLLLGGFLVWDLFFSNQDDGALDALTTLAEAALLVALSVSPLVVSQVWAFQRFCVQTSSSSSPSSSPSSIEAIRPWCRSATRSVYSFVQEHYWDVGPFRYWSVSQLPNFALAFPVLLLSLYAVASFVKDSSRSTIALSIVPASLRRVNAVVPPQTSSAATVANKTQGDKGHGQGRDDTPPALLSLKAHSSMVPHIVLTAVLAATLLFASHVQIALRFATPGGMPVVWWSLASLVLASRNGSSSAKHNKEQSGSDRLTRVAVNVALVWLAGWYACSIVLYAGFYPPA